MKYDSLIHSKTKQSTAMILHLCYSPLNEDNRNTGQLKVAVVYEIYPYYIPNDITMHIQGSITILCISGAYNAIVEYHMSIIMCTLSQF